jgi:hypothetical protein
MGFANPLALVFFLSIFPHSYRRAARVLEPYFSLSPRFWCIRRRAGALSWRWRYASARGVSPPPASKLDRFAKISVAGGPRPPPRRRVPCAVAKSNITRAKHPSSP